MRQPDSRPETFQIPFQTAERDHLHAFLCLNIQQSTFPHSPTKTGLSIVLKSKISEFYGLTANDDKLLSSFPPFSPERETCCMLPIYRLLLVFLFTREYSSIYPLAPGICSFIKAVRNMYPFAIKVSSSVFWLKKFLLYGFPLWRERGTICLSDGGK